MMDLKEEDDNLDCLICTIGVQRMKCASNLKHLGVRGFRELIEGYVGLLE